MPYTNIYFTLESILINASQNFESESGYLWLFVQHCVPHFR